MSMGFGFRAKLEESDGKVAAYSYRTYDLSCEEGRQGFGAAELDGVLWVANDGDDLSCEVERYSRFAPEQSCLNMSRAAVVVWGSSKRPLGSTLRVVAPDIIPADVKATSRAPFARP
jgi:hypothetical protein